MNDELIKNMYFFGLDHLKFYNRTRSLTSGIIIPNIYIGPNSFIELDVDYVINDFSSIEFAIIDGNRVKPIMPTKDQMIKNEKIFYAQKLRFDIDTNKPVVAKKNGIDTEDWIQGIETESNDLYTISYYPLDVLTAKRIKLDNEIIKLQIIMRLYDGSKDEPFIKSLYIKKFKE